MSNLARRIEKLEQVASSKHVQHLMIFDNHQAKLRIPILSMKNEFNERAYTPEPTPLQFHQSLGNSTAVTMMGPYGSGKSTALNWQVIFAAARMMPPCNDGVRRSKWAFVRNTYDELKQTTFEMWMSWFGELGETYHTLKPLEVTHRFNDECGAIELKVQFLALDKQKQYRKLKSSFFTAIYLNEACELPEGIFSQCLGRTGRYPSTDLLNLEKVKTWYERQVLLDDKWITAKVPYWSGVIADSNAPELESEMHDLFEVKKPLGFKLYKQPPGLMKTSQGWSVNPNAENLKRLGLDYYSKQAQGATEEFIRVFCCGEYGAIKQGKLIYEEYNDNIHAFDKLEVAEAAGIRLSFDTWYKPACVITQFASQQLRILGEVYEEDIYLETFIEDLVKPYLKKNFQGIKLVSVSFDPAGMAGEKVKGATSDYQILRKAFGDIVRPAPTNDIPQRHKAVQYLLTRINRGNPAFVLDKSKCDILRKGFLKHYVWEQSRVTSETIYRPKKNRYSHLQDALQYDAMLIVPQSEEQKIQKPSASDFLRPVRSYSREVNYASR